MLITLYFSIKLRTAGHRLPGNAHTPHKLRCAAKILYEIMLEGFLCLTKPSKRAIRGAVLLAPASMQERFCVSWHNFYSI